MSGGSDNEIKETEEEKALAEVSMEQWNFSQDTLNPLMDQYMAKTDAMATDAAYNYTRGRVNESAQIDQAGQRQNVSENMRGLGLDPSSGRAVMTNNELDTAQAGSAGEATGRATTEQTNQHVKGLHTITAIGSGQAAGAQAGLGEVANHATSEAIGDSYNTFNRNAANMQLLGSVAGAATSYGLENDWFKKSGTGHGIDPGAGPMAVENHPNHKPQSNLFDNPHSDVFGGL